VRSWAGGCSAASVPKGPEGHVAARHADVHDAYRILGTHGVCRLPVVSGGDIVGMLTVDDLLVGIATDLDRLLQPVVGELIFGHHRSPVPAVRAGVQLSSR
jgi:CBS domain-containing protein